MVPLNVSRAILLICIGLTGVVSWGCRSAPITGRKQLLIYPEQHELSSGLSAYQEVIKAETPSSNQQNIDLVNRVGQRIAAVAGRPDFQWEFRVIASPEQNAFCLPGGKVAVYEGILPICQNEAGLAVVMSHEIAHALARHGGERMSQSSAVNFGEKAVSYITQTQDAKHQEIVSRAYGLGTKYGYILPYSREHESEADHIGVLLMAQAGYDPQEAPRFWSRFASSQQGPAPIEFLSTHPTDQHRAQALTTLLPQAITAYQSAPNKYGLGDMIVVSAASNATMLGRSLGPPAPPQQAAGVFGPKIR